MFSFCVVGPYLSFSSSKFKLILKRFGKKFVFRQKKCVLIFRPKNHSQTIFIFVAFFLTFLIDFQFLCILSVSVVLQQVFE